MMNRLLPPVLRERVVIPRAVCWGAALASGWLAVESFSAFPNGLGCLIGVVGMLVSVALVLESGRRLDSAPPLFQTFWVLLGATVLPIVFVLALFSVFSAVGSRGEAPLTALVFWLILHVPFVLFLQNVDRSIITLLTILQWATITAFASRWARDWRVYEAVGFMVMTILVVGVVSVVCLLVLGYRLPVIDL
jgi:hypothetical protein